MVSAYLCRLEFDCIHTHTFIIVITHPTAFAAGQMLGPLVGGGLMDALPNVEEIGCVVAGRTEMRPAEEGGPCLSSFPWVSAVWGAVGVAAWLALVACLLCERGGAGKGLVGAIARRYRRFSTTGRPPVVEEGEEDDDDGSVSLPPALPSLELSAAGASTLSSYSRPSSGLGRRPVLVVTRSALGAHGRAAALMRSASGVSLLSRSRHSDGLSRSRHSERSLPYSTGAASASSLPRSGASAASVLSASRHSDNEEEEGGGGDWHGRCVSPLPQTR